MSYTAHGAVDPAPNLMATDRGPPVHNSLLHSVTKFPSRSTQHSERTVSGSKLRLKLSVTTR